MRVQWKLFISMFAVAMIILLILWACQVLMMSAFYQTVKTQELKKAANEFIYQIEKEGVRNGFEHIVLEGDINVRVINMSDFEEVFTGGDSHISATHDIGDFEILRLYALAKENAGEVSQFYTYDKDKELFMERGYDDNLTKDENASAFSGGNDTAYKTRKEIGVQFFSRRPSVFFRNDRYVDDFLYVKLVEIQKLKRRRARRNMSDASTINHASRAHALLSASSAHRWLACPPSAVAAEAYPQQDTDFTREGTLAHEVAEAIAKGCDQYTDDIGPTLPITNEMVECATGYRDYIQELTKSDDAIVLLEQRVDFSPWVPDGFGTCDCILIQGDTLTIIDYKYGVGVAVSAVDNPQMKLYALGALNDYGIALDVSRVEMHIYQPRINNISVDGLNVAELLEWAEKVVKPTADKAIKGKGDYTAGEHCKRGCARPRTA